MPYFSIIIPVYNVEPYLRECLDSVLAQTFTDWEAICIDDGSTDGSGAILDEYAAKDKRFRVIHQANEGVSVARNLALDLSTGDWVCFLDSDDIWDAETLVNVNYIIHKENPDLVRFRYKMFIRMDEVLGSGHITDYALITGEVAINRFVNDELIQAGYACLLFVRRTLLREVRFPIGVKYAEDALFSLDLFSKIKKIAQSEFVGYFYRIRGNSATRTLIESTERVRFFQSLERIINLYPVLPNFTFMSWFAVISWILRPKDIKRADAIHTQFKRLWLTGRIKASFLKPYARVPFYFYVLFGWVKPARYVYILIKNKIKF